MQQHRELSCGGDDRLDAQTLARLARIDPELLYPVKHRSAKAQADLIMIRARAGLVRARAGFAEMRRIGPARLPQPQPGKKFRDAAADSEVVRQN